MATKNYSDDPFAPKVEQTGIPNYTPAQGGSTDSAFGNLFEGLGKAAGMGINLADDVLQEHIRKDAQAGFEKANEPFTNAYSNPAYAPSDIVNSKERLGRLRQAYDQGKLSDTAYYSELTALTKRLKSKYPGYVNEVDEIIQAVTGVRPANALRNAALQELDAQDVESATKDKTWNNFILQQGNMGLINQSFPDLYADPAKYASDEARNMVYTKVAQLRGREAEIDMVRSQFAMDKDQYDTNKRIIESKQNQYFSYAVNESIAGLTKIMEQKFGTNLYTTLARLSDPKSGFKLSVEDQESLVASIRMRRDSLYNELFLKANTSSGGFKSPEEIKTQVNAAMAVYDTILSAIQSGNWDVAGQYARMSKAQTERDVWKLKQNENVRFIEAMGTLSPDLRANFYSGAQGLERLNDASKSMLSINLDNLNYADMTLGEVVSKFVGSDVATSSEKAGVSRATMQMVGVHLADPNADPEMWEALVNKVYNQEDIFKYFGDASQIEVFGMLTNPKITQKIMSSGDPLLKQKYYRWATSQLHRIGTFREMASDVGTIAETKQFLEASVDESGKLALTINEDKFNEWSSKATQPSRAVMARAMRKTMGYVENFNKTLSTVVPVIEGVGRKPQTDITALLANNGVNLDAREDSWFQWIVDGITRNDPSKVSEGDKNTSEEVKAGVLFEDFIRRHPEWVAPTGTQQGGLSPEIDDIIIKASAQQGVPPNYLRTIALIESSGDPSARSSLSTAGGLTQLTDDTAKALGVTDKFDPTQSAQGGAKLMAQNIPALRKVLGREPDVGEVYLAHQQGLPSALKLLKADPNELAVNVVPKEQVTNNGGTSNMTVAQFIELWTSKAKRVSRRFS